MGKLIDLTGQKFGRLTVVERVDNANDGHARWLCQCDCGKEKNINGRELRCGDTRSCGCLKKELMIQRNIQKNIHGHSSNGIISKVYQVWSGIIQRCNNPNNKRYKDYGGRGIRVCEAWLKFENFIKDMGEKPEGLTLDRIDNNDDYCPENCRWATRKEQQRNTRINRLITINGITKCIAEWCEIRKLPYARVWQRIYNLYWTPKEALELTSRKEK